MNKYRGDRLYSHFVQNCSKISTRYVQAQRLLRHKNHQQFPTTQASVIFIKSNYQLIFYTQPNRRMELQRENAVHLRISFIQRTFNPSTIWECRLVIMLNSRTRKFSESYKQRTWLIRLKTHNIPSI